jgi:hypothetical protein
VRAIALALLLALPAYAAPDGGWDVELYDAGTVLTTQMACTTPDGAMGLDVALRTAEKDRDGFKTVVLIAVPVSVLLAVATASLAVAYVQRR